MRKYLFIYKTEILSNLQYIFNIIIEFIGYFVMIFIFLNLWKYIYSDPNELINGYNVNQMIWYVIITEILWSTIKGRSYVKGIVNDVRGGNITYQINKPYSYVNYLLFKHLGDCTIRIIIYSILGMITGLVFLHTFPNLNIISLIAILLTGILAITINNLFLTIILLLYFYMEDSHPLYWLYSKLILIFEVIFPIEYFPKAIQPILNYSPIFVMNYGPAKLFVDFTWIKFTEIFIGQIIYLIIAYSLCSYIYKKGVKKLNVNGG